jgi:hypothetical protein
MDRTGCHQLNRVLNLQKTETASDKSANPLTLGGPEKEPPAIVGGLLGIAAACFSMVPFTIPSVYPSTPPACIVFCIISRTELGVCFEFVKQAEKAAKKKRCEGEAWTWGKK